ncbi:hypothetical protein MA20_47425 [Bradyrhizobium japonicum]|uniref:Uncharacterized protein n=1 Tax=Bradyrhizobium japonicum TaxID=375 RepID=A0A0A3XF43_BRAJP|nr:hypothetical protein MA20_47425 [Bradyrhizobium japonicum]
MSKMQGVVADAFLDHSTAAASASVFTYAEDTDEPGLTIVLRFSQDIAYSKCPFPQPDFVVRGDAVVVSMKLPTARYHKPVRRSTPLILSKRSP